MNWNTLAMDLLEMIIPLIGAALIALIGYGIAYLRKQTAKINNDMAREALDAALSEADKVATDAVAATNQMLVDDLKAEAADGKLTIDEATRAMANAATYFLQHISAGSRSILEKSLGPVNAWLRSFLEAKLGIQKESRTQIIVEGLADPLSLEDAN